jgi:hypothetical protein
VKKPSESIGLGKREQGDTGSARLAIPPMLRVLLGSRLPGIRARIIAYPTRSAEERTSGADSVHYGRELVEKLS